MEIQTKPWGRDNVSGTEGGLQTEFWEGFLKDIDL